MSSSSMIIEFTKSTQNVCMCVGLSMLLIICFMISPLNSFILSSIFGKVIISINKSLKDFENVDQKDFVLQKDNKS